MEDRCIAPHHALDCVFRRDEVEIDIAIQGQGEVIPVHARGPSKYSSGKDPVVLSNISKYS